MTWDSVPGSLVSPLEVVLGLAHIGRCQVERAVETSDVYGNHHGFGSGRRELLYRLVGNDRCSSESESAYDLDDLRDQHRVSELISIREGIRRVFWRQSKDADVCGEQATSQCD